MSVDRENREDGGKEALYLTALLLIALLFRVAAFIRLPIAHDEINVVAYGLTRIFLTGDPIEFFFRTPFTVSNGITPLWFWIQAVPAGLMDVTSRTALRIMPMIFGLVGVWLAFIAGRRIGGLRTGWFSGLFYASAGLLLYTNGRGEFAESLIAPLMILLFLDLEGGREGRPVPFRAAFWPGLILFTYLGKGLPVWAVYSLGLLVIYLVGLRRDESDRRIGPGRMIAMIVLPVLPSLIWLALVQASLFGGGQQVYTDIGPSASVWESIWNLTLGYGSVVKEFMVGTWHSALYLFTDYQVWPGMALLAFPACVGMGRQLGAALSGLRRARWDQVGRAIIPCLLVIPIFVLLVSKGMFSSRFHLLYIPIVLPYAALAIHEWIESLRNGRWQSFLGWGSPAVGYLAWTASWVDRREGLHDWKLFALIFLAGLTSMAILSGMAVAGKPSPKVLAAGMAVAVSFLMVAGSLFAGVLDWGRQYAWEPELRLTLPDSTSNMPNAELQLARQYLQREQWLASNSVGNNANSAANSAAGSNTGRQEIRGDVVRRARPVLLKALASHPDDGATIRELTGELWLFSMEDRPYLEELLKLYMQRQPDDDQMAAHARRLKATR